ncbi:cellulose biosynthesis protein BcsF [Zobellella sp. DQSA1]|uniref:cellulose biosynthesis protein BcsF n=1 Tax=Zobellella sp. DQSA1 TaxID=3342386 RepID=UPI0035BF374D
MPVGDIVSLFILLAVVLLPLGYFLRGWWPRRWRQWRQHFLAPRYLKWEGTRQRPTTTTSRSAHDPKN